MKKIVLASLVFSAILGLSACSGMSNETKGTLVGAGVGGAVGALATDNPVWAAVGAVAGGAVGNYVGRQSDEN